MAFEMLDIGIVMSSPTLWVFEEMVQRYPGANYFYQNFKERCTCDDEHCAREAMQDNLNHLFEGDKGQCAIFFQRLSELDQQPSDIQIQAVLGSMGRIVSTGAEDGIVESRLREALEGLLPGIKVTRILPPE